MVHLAHKFLNLFRNLGLILWSFSPKGWTGRFAILSGYLQMLLGFSDRALGYRFHYFFRHELLSNFEEIFIKNTYYFQPETESPSIIDGGANLGEEIIYFKWLYPKAKILGFEPGADAFKMLLKNIKVNNLKNVTLRPYALSNKKRRADFYIEIGNPAAASMSLNKQRLNKGRTKVQTVCLSSYIRHEVDFLKLDIEGEEFAVITELTRKNKLRLIKQFVIEFHHHINSDTDKLSSLLKIFEENGFGYQLSTPLQPPFEKKIYQDILIFGYRRN